MAGETKMPRARNSLPLLGHSLMLMRDPLGFISSLTAYGDLVEIMLGPRPAVMVCDPEMTRQVLLDGRSFDKGGPLFERLRESTGNGLGTCPNAEHKRQRRLCQPTFQPGRFTGYGEAMAETFDAASRAWQDGQLLDVSSEMSALSLKIAVRTMFSASLDAQVTETVAEDFSTLIKGLFRRTVMPSVVNRLPTPGNRSYYQALSRLRRTIEEIVQNRRDDSTDYGDFLSSLLHAHDPEGPGAGSALTDEELTDQVFTFFLGGSESTASVLPWALDALSRNSDVLARLRDEVDGVLSGGHATFERLPDLKLTTNIVTETLRLHPPAWLLTRTVTTDTVLGGNHLAAGTIIALSPHLVHRRPDLYEKPDEFVPDRWENTRPDRAAYLPFGSGARKCIGDRFALSQATLALATIASRWEWEAVVSPPAVTPLNRLPTPPGLLMRLTSRRPSPVGTGSETEGNR